MSRRTTGFAGRMLVVLALSAAMLCPGMAPPPAVAQEVQEYGRVTGLPMPRFVSLRSDTVNARRGPGLDHRIDWEFVQRGLPVQVVAEYGNWRRIADSDGVGGWVLHSLLSGARTGLVLGEGNLALMTGRRPSDDAKAELEPGVVVRIQECDGDWCRVSVGRSNGWVQQARLWGVKAGEVID